jgi:hypothetical protein
LGNTTTTTTTTPKQAADAYQGGGGGYSYGGGGGGSFSGGGSAGGDSDPKFKVGQTVGGSGSMFSSVQGYVYNASSNSMQVGFSSSTNNLGRFSVADVKQVGRGNFYYYNSATRQ